MYQEMNKFDYTNDKHNINYEVSFSKHLFHVRNGDNKPRGYMFETIGQIKRFLDECINNYCLLSYKNKGKVGVKFTFKGNVHAALIAIECNMNIMDDITRITFVTIDKLADRHYNSFAMYHNVINTIDMSKYVLLQSNFSISTQHRKIGRACYDKHKYTVINYKCIDHKIDKLLSIVTECDSMFSSILAKMLQLEDSVRACNNGAFWASIKLVTNITIYIKISIVDITDIEKYIIVLNVVPSKSYHTLVKNGRGDDPYYDLEIENVFGVVKIKNNINERNLKIVKKTGE